MQFVNQPTAMPTHTLSASLIGYIIGAVAFGVAVEYFPAIDQELVVGLSTREAAQFIVAGLLGYIVPDGPNSECSASSFIGLQVQVKPQPMTRPTTTG